ncbi:MAG TPA: hypothetical protein VJ860_14010 [Polyangia bacterium]|nr:hypothetical protein [Polyangia bacterium]
MSSHSSPQRLLTGDLGDKARLAVLPLVLVTAWLSAAGCAGPQVYVPFEQRTRVSAATRWQALESVAKREQWNVVLASPAGYTMVAYSNPAGTAGVRDRIKVELFSHRTVVETGSEIEDQGHWQVVPGRCENYTFSREKALAAQIDNSQATPASPAVPRKGTELAAR